ncbi:MAG: four helix bundle protein [Planctomycetota bacterium]|jgi:four helix bundle protein
MRDHRKLKAFEFADEMTQRVYGATCAFPEEQFSLGAELRRSAVEATSRLVAACAHSGTGDYVKGLEGAYGAAKRVEYQLGLVKRLGYIQEGDCRELDESCLSTCKMLNGLIRAVRDGGKRKNGSNAGGAQGGNSGDGGGQKRGVMRPI